jgi:hypothetical protein
MSESHFVKLIDPRLDTHSNRSTVYVLGHGAQTVAYVPQPASSYSNQTLTFNLNNIAQFVGRDPRLVLNLTANVAISITNATTSALNFVNSDNFGLRSWPVNRCMSSIQHKINQASYTLNTNEIIDALCHINSVPENANFYDNTQPDCVDNYATATGSNITPLASFTTTIQGDGIYKPRTLNYTVSSNSIPASSTRTIYITVNLSEPLATPFCNIGKTDEPVLWGINGEIISIQWVNDLFNNMFSLVVPTGLTVNSATVDLTSVQPSLDCIYITPYEDDIPKIPHQSIQHYNDYQIFNSVVKTSATAPGANVNAVSSIVAQFTNVPQKILVYVRPTNSARSASLPDVYLTLNNISVQWDNGQPQLSSANGNQLFEVSQKNGLCMDREQFLGEVLNSALVAGGADPVSGVGSVLVLDPVFNLGCRPGISNGSPGRYIMQITNANFTNNTSQTISSVSLYIVGVSNAILERNGTEYRNYLISLPDGALSRARMMNAINRDWWYGERFSNQFLNGGGLGNLFKKALSLGKQGLSKGLNLLAQNPDIVSQGLQMAQKALGGRAKTGYAKSVHPKKNMDLFFE